MRSNLPRVSIEVIGPGTSFDNKTQTQENNKEIIGQEKINHIEIIESNVGQVAVEGRHDIVISRCRFYEWKGWRYGFIIMALDSNLLIEDTSFTGFSIPVVLILVDKSRNFTIENTNFTRIQHHTYLIIVESKHVQLQSVNFYENFCVSLDNMCKIIGITADWISIENSAFVSNFEIPGQIVSTFSSNTVLVRGNIFINNSIISKSKLSGSRILSMN